MTQTTTNYLDLLGKTVQLRLHETGLNKTIISGVIGQELGFNTGSGFDSYFRHIAKGWIYGSPTMNPSRETQMPRLSALLYALDIPEDHELINDLRSIDDLFKYPPEEDLRDRIESKKETLAERGRNNSEVQSYLNDGRNGKVSFSETMMQLNSLKSTLKLIRSDDYPKVQAYLDGIIASYKR